MKPVLAICATCVLCLLVAAPTHAAGYTPPGVLDCPISQKRAKNGQKPKRALVSKVIRCLWERPATESREAQKVDIKSLSIGQKRKWNVRDDIGGGRRGTWVWPIRVNWVWSRYYSDSTMVQRNLSVFNCYVNSFREWECGLARRIKDGELERKPPQSR
jgi:hypothetical protein